MYEAFSSKLFVDECDLNNKLQAFQEVEKMFQTEISVLTEMIKSAVAEDERIAPLLKKIASLKNLSITMNGLIKNITSELEASRE